MSGGSDFQSYRGRRLALEPSHYNLFQDVDLGSELFDLIAITVRSSPYLRSIFRPFGTLKGLAVLTE